MKIFCVGRNYADHVKELQNEIPTEPVIFMKPDTAILKENAPFYYPSFSKEIHPEIELVVKIDQVGKNIAAKFASKYYSQVAIGIDFTARDVQNRLKSKGLPWEIAKSFDHSAVISDFIPKTSLDLNNSTLKLTVNESIRQNGNTSDMIFSIDQIISYISSYFTLKTGDLIYTGTPAVVNSVQIGDKITCSLNEKEMLFCEVK